MRYTLKIVGGVCDINPRCANVGIAHKYTCNYKETNGVKQKIYIQCSISLMHQSYAAETMTINAQNKMIFRFRRAS